MIRSLLYLTASRSNIMFSVGVCACFHANPKESHLIIVNRTFKYLNGTRDLGLCYPNKLDVLLVGYSNSDFANYKVDKKKYYMKLLIS